MLIIQNADLDFFNTIPIDSAEKNLPLPVLKKTKSMKQMKLTLSALVMLVAISAAQAQQSEKINKLLNIEKDEYFGDRDSANKDAYYALKKLILGNKRFSEGKSIRPRQTDEVLKEAGSGQQPYATIVGCSDSRVPNEIIFDQGVGDLFIVRTAGQVMAEASYGTIEYSTEVLKTQLIVVLGHESCGAVDAAMKLPDNPPGHVVTLINAIKPAALRAKNSKHPEKEKLNIAIRENVLEQVKELRELEPVLSKRFLKGEILIVGAVYDIDSGKVEFIEETITSLPKFAAAKK